MSAHTYEKFEGGPWVNEYAAVDYGRVGDALLQLQLQPPGSLDDYNRLRSMPAPDDRLTKILDTPIDELVLNRSRRSAISTLLVPANAILDWNGNAPYFRTRHVLAMGLEGMESIRTITPSRAERLGSFVAAVSRLTVPVHPCPELSAYVCRDLRDVPAYAVTKGGRAVVFARKNMAAEARDGLRGNMFLEGLKSISQGRTEAEVKDFESRFWLAKALFQSTVPGSSYYVELGGVVD